MYIHASSLNQQDAGAELIEILMRLNCPLMARGARKQLKYFLKDPVKREMLHHVPIFLEIHKFLADYDLTFSVRRVAFDVMEIPFDEAEGWPSTHKV